MGFKPFQVNVRDRTFNHMVKLLTEKWAPAMFACSQGGQHRPFQGAGAEGLSRQAGQPSRQKGEGRQPLAAAAMTTVSRGVAFLWGI